jgi:hypothetical protein
MIYSVLQSLEYIHIRTRDGHALLLRQSCLWFSKYQNRAREMQYSGQKYNS